jgi:hypothetical protein
MGPGGVETEHEYQTSLINLQNWLGKMRDSKMEYCPDVVHNAIILQEFLNQKILTHKERWFYAARVSVDGCMSLEQKATSAVESQNQTMKWSSSKRVTPSMSCCESLMTQDTQHKTRMDNRRIQIMSDVRSHPLWAKTRTATHVTKRAESVLQQRKSQVGKYAFRAVSEWEVQMVRYSKTQPYFCPNCDNMKTCRSCSTSSPITKFRRLRRITITRTHDNGFEMRCSCLAYSDTGIPCHHVCCLLTIERRHIFVRWHRQYAACYNRPKYEEWTDYYKRRRSDRRLLITFEEYSKVMEFVKRNQGAFSAELFVLDNSIPNERNPSGLLTSTETFGRKEESTILRCNRQVYESGLLSQETCETC